MAKCSHQKPGNRKTLRSWAGVRCRGLASPEGILHTGAVESQDPKRCWAGAGTSSARRCPPGTAALASWSGSLTRGLPVSCSTRTEPAFSDELVPTKAAEGTGSPPCQITCILAQQCSKKSSSRARSSPAQLDPIFQESCPTPHRKLSFRQDYKLNSGQAQHRRPPSQRFIPPGPCSAHGNPLGQVRGPWLEAAAPSTCS